MMDDKEREWIADGVDKTGQSKWRKRDIADDSRYALEYRKEGTQKLVNMNRCQETIGVDRLNPLKECELGVKSIAKRLKRKDRDRTEAEGERGSRRLEEKQKDKETDKDWIGNSCKVETN